MKENIFKVIAPNMLNLANQGTIITDMYVQPVCTPSRSALMTSRKKLQILELFIMLHMIWTISDSTIFFNFKLGIQFDSDSKQML